MTQPNVTERDSVSVDIALLTGVEPFGKRLREFVTPAKGSDRNPWGLDRRSRLSVSNHESPVASTESP